MKTLKGLGLPLGPTKQKNNQWKDQKNNTLPCQNTLWIENVIFQQLILSSWIWIFPSSYAIWIVFFNQWLTQLVQKRICTVPKLICISALKNRDLHCWSRCNCKYIFGFCARYTYVHKGHTYICTLHASAPRVRLVIRRWDSDFIGTVCIKSSMSKFHQYIYKYITLSQYKRTSWQSYHFEIHMYNIFHPQSKNPAGCCLKMH